MDRYSILLKKEYKQLRKLGEEFSWNYESRLRLIVRGGPRTGKTTYLINDMINMIKTRKSPTKYIFCTPNNSWDHLRGLLAHHVSDSAWGQIEVCSWNDFWPRTTSLRGCLTVYFDDAHTYRTESKDGNISDPFSVRSLMAYAVGRLCNIPRIVITCPEHSIDSSSPIPKGNWDWRFEDLTHRRSL